MKLCLLSCNLSHVVSLNPGLHRGQTRLNVLLVSFWINRKSNQNKTTKELSRASVQSEPEL